MEYLIGLNHKDQNILRTISNPPTPYLTGHQTLQQEFSEQTITDTFIIKEKIHETTDPIGNHYVWYEIDQHYRNIDKTKFLSNKIEETSQLVETTMCDQETQLSKRITNLENTLCEIDKNGGQLL